ncbi:MAG: (d)CMP kinase, partial [Spirochaetota bacterium]
MMSGYVIAVDGPAGSGKSTVCRRVALKRGISYVDSGALYRAVTLYLIEQYGNVQHADYSSSIGSIQLEQRFNSDTTVTTFLNGRDVSAQIRTEEVLSQINEVSSREDVRGMVCAQLRSWRTEKSLIMDGRDIGSVVFPDAAVKVYLDASVDVRAARRYDEYVAAGKNVDLKSIKNQIIHRDNQDRLRDHGALVQSPDATHIDTSDMSIDEVVAVINAIADSKLNTRNGKSDKMMENVDNIFEDNVSMDELMGESIDPSSGEVINGEVVSADNDFVYVNVGGKTEGRVPASDFDTLPAAGDVVNVFVTKKRTVEGMYQLSHKLAETIVQWARFAEWYTEENNVVKGRVVSIKQNGAIVDFGIYKGFVPKNLAADIRFKDAVNTDTEYEFKIVKVDEKKKSVILSRRDYLDEIRSVAWNRIVENYGEGDTITGTVTRLVEFGAFVDLGGFEALLHKNDISWRKVYTRKDYIKKGDTKEFKILAVNNEEKKISLGLKQMREDPWKSAAERYVKGGEYDGTISGTSNFGVFVELEEGVEGLVPAEETVWAKKAPNPKSLFRKGDKTRVRVLAINPEEKTLSLSIKQTQDNPWHTLQDRFPVGSVATGKIKNIVEYGMFVELEDKVDAFIH